MFVIKNSNLAALVAAMKNVNLGKVTFTMFTKKVQDGDNEAYMCMARITSAVDQIQIGFTVPYTDDMPPVAFTVSAKKFVEISDAILSFEKDVLVEVQDGQMILTVEGITSLNIPLEAEADAEIKFDNTGAIAFFAEGKGFGKMIRRGGLAAEASAEQDILKNVALKLTIPASEEGDKTLECYSTDGHVIAYAKGAAQQIKIAEGNDKKEATLAIPAETFGRMVNILKEAQMVKFMFNDTMCAVGGAGAIMYTFTLGAKVFEVNNYLKQWADKGTEAEVTVDADSILNTVKVLEVAEGKAMVVTMRNSDNKLSLETNSTNNSVTVSATAQNGSLNPEDETSIYGISSKLLVKIVKSLNKGNVTIRTNNEGQFPFIFSNGTVTEPDESATVYCLKVRSQKATQAAPAESEADATAEAEE